MMPPLNRARSGYISSKLALLDTSLVGEGRSGIQAKAKQALTEVRCTCRDGAFCGVFTARINFAIVSRYPGSGQEVHDVKISGGSALP